MNHEHSSEAFFELIRRELYTAVVGDVMDSIGFRHQFLPPQIKPLRNDMIIVGRSMPVLEADVFTEAHDAASNSVMSRPFWLDAPVQTYTSSGRRSSSAWSIARIRSLG